MGHLDAFKRTPQELLRIKNLEALVASTQNLGPITERLFSTGRGTLTGKLREEDNDDGTPPPPPSGCRDRHAAGTPRRTGQVKACVPSSA